MQVGTGNYNSANAKLYTDISLITANPMITKDIEIFFKVPLPLIATLLTWFFF